MEDLNKNQIILLTLLISFVTSIATGIMTTSLLMEAPVEVTQTINRVVEKTIETVTPAGPSEIIGSKKEATKEVVTVVVSEDDRIVEAIEKNSKNIVRIRAKSPSLEVDNFYGLGLIVSLKGLIISDKKPISEVMDYVAIFSDGTELTLTPIFSDKKTQLGFFSFKPKEGQKISIVNISSAEPKLGQSVIVVGGDIRNAVSTGRITSLNTVDVSTTTKSLVSIDTDVSPIDLVKGAPLLSLSGDVLGVSLSSEGFSFKQYYPASMIKKEISYMEENE